MSINLMVVPASATNGRCASSAGGGFSVLFAMTPEALAREQIDAQLAACDWNVQNFKAVDFFCRTRHCSP
ncbi:MAG: hypothetical protein HY736_04215 [Verrucomicrobia bacterium]|nr:hypothetical protein [Verrucomicrobiota bacterium]